VTEGGCAEVAVRLSAWIDGELNPSEAAGLREHLAICVQCRSRHALLTAVGRAVRSLPPEAVSADFEDTFRRRLAATRTGAGRARERSPILVAAAALAALLVLAVLGPFPSRRVSLPAETPTTGSKAVPRWLATCGAPTTVDCQREMPCASPATCGVVSVASSASALRFGPDPALK
jgi:anti-sigma factor RsiW